MLQIHNFEGKSKEELIEKALNILEVNKDEVIMSFNEIEGKIFKLKKYELLVLKNNDLINYIKEFFSKLSNLMKIDINYEIKMREELLNINLITSDNSIIIGKDGRTLNAIQSLLKQSLNNKVPFNIKITVDVSDYRTKKNKHLEYEVKKIAKDVLKTKIDVQLDPMNSYKRRIVHTIISEYDELESISEGEEPNRFIIVKYKEK